MGHPDADGVREWKPEQWDTTEKPDPLATTRDAAQEAADLSGDRWDVERHAVFDGPFDEQTILPWIISEGLA